MTGGCVFPAPRNYAQISQKPMTNNKREAMTLSLTKEDKDSLAQVAEECGYANVTAFVRAIAQRRIEIAAESNLSRRIDVLRDRINALSEQRDADWRVVSQLQEAVYKKIESFMKKS